MLLLDRGLGAHLAALLRERGLEAAAFADHFAPETPDHEWLAVVAERGWALLTDDQHLRRNGAQRQTLLSHRVAAFLLLAPGRPRAEQAAALARGWDEIQRLTAQARRPFLQTLHLDGTVGLRGRALGRLPLPARSRRVAEAPGSYDHGDRSEDEGQLALPGFDARS